MDFPSNILTCTTEYDENPTVVTVHVQSDNDRVDETALTYVIQQWLADNPAFTSVTAARHEQTFPITPIDPPPGG